MNSDLMPSPESSNSTASKEAPTKIDAAANVKTVTAKSSKPDPAPLNASESDANGNLANRQQPIPPPSEPMQYRAIGLVRGRYCASSEQFTQGMLVTADDVELNAVLLGRIMSLVKNHLDLEKEHLWVVYPRTRQENDSLHIQIVGVWEPENLAKNFSEEDDKDMISQVLERPDNGSGKKSARPTAGKEEISEPLKASSELPDGDFSVRGEVVYQSFDAKSLVVKIKQAPRKPTDKPKYFKLKLRGVLTTKAVGKFWDFKVKREADVLVIDNAEAIADLPKKRKPPFKSAPRGGGGRRPFPPRRSSGEAPPLPIKRTGGDISAVSKPVPKPPAPKPIKKPKATEE